MAHGGRKSEKAGNMGSRGGKSRGPQMTKKSTGFGAKVGKRKTGPSLDGPNMGLKGIV